MAQPPASAPSSRSPWVALLARSAALPVLVTLPLLGIAFRADERFNVYRFGAEYGRRPQGLLTDQIRDVPRFLRNGNFRPVGRVVEHLQELVAFQAAEALGVAPHVAMRASASLWLGVLAVALVVLVQTAARPGPWHATTPVRATTTVAPLFAVGAVAAGSQSAVVLFSNFYVQSALVVVVLALLAARHGHFGTGRPGAVPLLAAVVLGAAAASFNEIAYLAVPVAAVLVAVRGRVAFGLSWTALARTRAVRLLLAGAVGFAAVFVPVRVLIVRLCAEVSCYAQSSVELSPDAAGLLVQRVTSWFPPAAWSVAVGSGPGRWYLTGNLVLVLVAVVTATIAVQLLRSRAATEPTARAVIVGLAVIGVTLLVLPGIIGAISEGRLAAWREGSIRSGAGWRDTPLLLGGAAVTLTAAIELVRDRVGAVVTGGFAALLAVGLVLTVLANDTFATRDAWRTEPHLHHRIAAHVTSFDRSEEGDARRCALYDEFVALHPTNRQHQERLRLGLDEVARRAADRPWCEARS